MIDLFPLVRPFIFMMDPEKAHNLTIKLLKLGLSPVLFKGKDATSLKTSVLGLTFDNPIGLAAGFDKNADVMDAMLGEGFGFVEAGTVTPKPQAGNPLPRLFRLKEDRAVINRFGFNNEGLDVFTKKLRARLLKKGQLKQGIVGANVGANKDADDRTLDYVTGIKALYGLCDYFTVNISSPNTPGLRALQSKEALEELVKQVLAARDEAIASGADRTPIVIKIAPDLLEQDKIDIADIAMSYDIDGLIVTNTTIERPDSLQSIHKAEAGGLSGTPLMQSSTDVVADIYKLTKGTVPLIGAGGIASGADAYAKIRAGASLVQVYSMLVFEGTGLVTRIKHELADLLARDGFETVADAVGADHR